MPVLYFLLSPTVSSKNLNFSLDSLLLFYSHPSLQVKTAKHTL